MPIIGMLDRDDICDLLMIRKLDLLRLQRNPNFPKPVMENRTEVLWDEKEIAEWRDKLDQARGQGLKVPECFYSWDDVDQ